LKESVRIGLAGEPDTDWEERWEGGGSEGAGMVLFTVRSGGEVAMGDDSGTIGKVAARALVADRLSGLFKTC